MFMDLEHYAKIIAQQQGQREGRRPRSTLNAAVAVLLKPFFDEACDNVREVLIPYEMYPRCSRSTVYTKVCDSLLWYTEVDRTISDEERRKYILLKGSFKIVQGDKGIRLVPRLSLTPSLNNRVSTHATSQASVATFERAHQTTSVSWKSDFLAWVQDGPVGSTFYRKGLALTQDDVEWVVNYAKQLDWSAKVNIESVMVTKES